MAQSNGWKVVQKLLSSDPDQGTYGYHTTSAKYWPLHARIKRAIWRKLLGWRFLLWQRYRYNNLVLERVAERPFLILPGVFNPVLFRTGEFMAQSLGNHLIPFGAAVLDLGTGSGVGAVFAAQAAKWVVAVDVNPAAVRCARINALLNGVEGQVEVRQGDLFASVLQERFDVVLFNPPFFRRQPKNDLERALYSLDIFERFTDEVRDHLKPGGTCLVIMSTDGDLDGFRQAARRQNFSIELIQQRDLINEWLLLYRLRPED
jgi:HemK-related putative methylase